MTRPVITNQFIRETNALVDRANSAMHEYTTITTPLRYPNADVRLDAEQRQRIEERAAPFLAEHDSAVAAWLRAYGHQPGESHLCALANPCGRVHTV